MSFVTLVNQASGPGAPAAGRVSIFAKLADSHIYIIDENGVETDLTAGLSDTAVRKSTAGTLAVGDAVYLVGWDGSASVLAVEKAQANSSSTMPAIGVISEEATDSANGRVRLNGQINGVDTSAWAVGSNLYVSTSVAGSFTVARPTGDSDVVQQLCKVAKSDASTGVLVVQHSGHGNDLPQLAEEMSWVGDANNQPVEVGLIANIRRNAKTGIDAQVAGLFVINAGDNTKVDIAAGHGHILDFTSTPDDPDEVEMDWSAFNALSVTNIATEEFTVFYIEDTGGGVPGVFQESVFPTPQKRRSKILIGFALHIGNTVVEAVSTTPILGFDIGSTLDDLMIAIGDFNITGNVYSANGANLLLDKSAGVSFGRVINATVALDNPNNKLNVIETGISTYSYSWQDGVGGFDSDVQVAIDPERYDDSSGTRASVPLGEYTVQRLSFDPRTELTAFEYGQATFSTIADAIDSISENGVAKNPQLSGLVLRAWLVIEQGTTDIDSAITGGTAKLIEFTGELSQPSGVSTDSDAVHVNVAAEISGVANKAAPASADVLIIEDSADSFSKKSAGLGAIVTALTGPDADTRISTHNSDASAHTALSRVDGTRAYTGEVAGVTPTVAASLTRKDYVDTKAASEAAAAVSTHNTDVAAHTALSRIDGTRAFTGQVAGITPTTGPALATKSYVDSAVQGIEWQDTVLDRDLATPPGGPTTGDRYIVATGGTGAWATHDDEIAEWDGAAWLFTVPTEGMTVGIDDENRNVRWDTASWVFFGTTIDHGNLAGLGDDDHLQYSLVSGARAFTGEIEGITPTAAASLTRKDYVDGEITTSVSTHNTDIAAHTALSRIDGTRAFTGEVAGVTPTLAPSLTRKDYVDAKIATDISTHNSDATAHTALSRVDGTRAFTGEVAGVDPTVAASLSTKAYVDTKDSDIRRNAKTGLDAEVAGLLAINGGDPTKVDIAAGHGHILDFAADPENPTEVEMDWSAFTAVTLTDLATAEFTSLFIEDTGGGVPGVFQSTASVTPELRREKIYLGVATHTANTVVERIIINPVLGFDTGSSLDDLMDVVGDVNTSGNVYSANGANLLLDKSAGASFGRVINAENSLAKPHNKTNTVQLAISSYFYSYQDGSSDFQIVLEVALDPDQWDDGSGTLQAVTSNDFTVQRLLFDPRSEATGLEYGQVVYNNLSDAIDGIAANGIQKAPEFSALILIGWVVMREGITDLASAISGGTAKIIEATGEIGQPSGAGTDANAIHVNLGGEINTIAAKATPISTDIIVIEDAAATFDKKKVELGSVVTALTGPDADTRIGTHNADAAAHVALSRVDGTRAYTGEVAGVTPTTGPALATKDYVDSAVQGIEWQDTVLDRDLATPPGGPTTGDRYIVATGGTGDWATHDDEITEWDGSAWVFTVPTVGMTVGIDDENRNVRWSGSAWAFFGTTVDHGNLAGLGDDDHTIYSLTSGARAFTGEVGGIDPTVDASLATKGYVDTEAASAGVAAVATHNADVSAHTALTKIDGTRPFTGEIAGVTPTLVSSLTRKDYVDAGVSTHNSDASAHTGLLKLDGTRTMTGALKVTGNDPEMWIIEDDAATDGGKWRFSASGGTFFFMAVNDAETVVDQLFQVDRAAAVIARIRINKQIAIEGNDIVFNTGLGVGFKIANGSGTPEGSVSAGVGSGYFNATGDADTAFYVKASGGSTTGWLPVITSGAWPDNTFRVQDNSDATKEAAFECSSITTATTRTMTVPDRDITLGQYHAPVLFSDGDLDTSTTTRYLFPGGQAGTATTSEVVFVAPYAGDIDQLYVNHVTAGTGAANLTYTVRKNASDTSLLVVVSNTATSGSDLANSISVAAGDKISVSVAKSATLSTSPAFASAQMRFRAS